MTSTSAHRRAQPGNAPIRIVDIDDESLAKIGQWPWPRTIVAELVDKLREAGAAVVAFDIDFAEPDRTSPRMLLPLLSQNHAGEAEIGKLLAALPDPDQRLAAAMRTVPTVTGFILVRPRRSPAAGGKGGVRLCRRRPARPCRRFPHGDPDLPVLEKPPPETGFSTSPSIGTMSCGACR